MPERMPLIATTLTGLEPVLAEELSALGAEDVAADHRAVRFRGGVELMYAACYGCRTAIRVLKPIREFAAPDERTLYDEVGRVDWRAHLDAERTFAITAVLRDASLRHSQYVAQRCKDAIVDQLRARTGRRPSVDTVNPHLRINVRIHRDRATLSLDASGESLHKRGYRGGRHETPISEVLAAGILALAGWDGTCALVDGMCGSGTFLIEGALRARDVPPGRTRRVFGFQRWKDYDAQRFAAVKQRADARAREATGAAIVGCDIDPAAVRAARANAARAGTSGSVHVETGDFHAFAPPDPPGILVMNPPYGERTPTADVEALYRSIGDTLKRKYAGYTAYLITGNLHAAKRIGLRASRRVPLYNGPLECRLLAFPMYDGSRRSV